MPKLYVLKVVDPICSLKMWDWIKIMVCKSKYHVRYRQLYDFMYIIIIEYFSSLHNFVVFKDICKWDLLPLKGECM